MEGVVEFMAFQNLKNRSRNMVESSSDFFFEIFLVVPKFIFSILTSDLEDLIDRQSSSSSEEP